MEKPATAAKSAAFPTGYSVGRWAVLFPCGFPARRTTSRLFFQGDLIPLTTGLSSLPIDLLLVARALVARSY